MEGPERRKPSARCVGRTADQLAGTVPPCFVFSGPTGMLKTDRCLTQ